MQTGFISLFPGSHRLTCWLLLAASLSAIVTVGWAEPNLDDRKIRRSVVLEGVLGDKVVLSIDGERKIRSVGQDSTDGVQVLEIFLDQIVADVDGERRQIRLGDHDVVITPFQERQSVTVTIPRDSFGMYTTVGSINGLPVQFLVDTGATTIAMNSLHARRLAIDYRLKGKPVLVNTAAGMSPAYLVTLDKVTVGEITLQNVGAVVLEGEFPLQVLLGMTFLGQMEIQRNGTTLRLEKKF